MEAAILVLTHVVIFAAGFAVGKLRGYLDAQPKRDKSGRFISKD